MKKNLLIWTDHLTEMERKEITDAMRNHSPQRIVIDYDDDAIWFLDREVVIAALLQVHRVYETVAARDLAPETQRGTTPHSQRR
jgi:hypothetical protein